MCLACGRLGGGLLCPECRLGMRAAPERLAAGTIVVRPALLHVGPARTLVHVLKYRGVVSAAAVLAEYMAPSLPDGAVLVPVPRLGWRLLKYGVDPAVELARAVASLTGSPVATPLRAPFWGRSRAGRAHRGAPSFRSVGRLGGPVVLVDDVVTTGSTLASAASSLPSVTEALTATGHARPPRGV